MITCKAVRGSCRSHAFVVQHLCGRVSAAVGNNNLRIGAQLLLKAHQVIRLHSLLDSDEVRDLFWGGAKKIIHKRPVRGVDLSRPLHVSFPAWRITGILRWCKAFLRCCCLASSFMSQLPLSSHGLCPLSLGSITLSVLERP